MDWVYIALSATLWGLLVLLTLGLDRIPAAGGRP